MEAGGSDFPAPPEELEGEREFMNVCSKSIKQVIKSRSTHYAEWPIIGIENLNLQYLKHKIKKLTKR